MVELGVCLLSKEPHKHTDRCFEWKSVMVPCQACSAALGMKVVHTAPACPEDAPIFGTGDTPEYQQFVREVVDESVRMSRREEKR